MLGRMIGSWSCKLVVSCLSTRLCQKFYDNAQHVLDSNTIEQDTKDVGQLAILVVFVLVPRSQPHTYLNRCYGAKLFRALESNPL